jgi:uncharacterized membrane protein
MGRQRLEAFTDGVIAIVITIMVLDMKVPQGASFAAMKAGLPIFLVYALSFTNVAIFWNNHHHMLHVTERVNGAVLWATMFLLFWLTLVPFAIRWIDQEHFAALPMASYGAILVMAGVGYSLLERAIIRYNGPQSKLAQAIGDDLKGHASIVLYVCAVGLAFVRPWIALTIYVVIAAMWFIPDKRIESVLEPKS